MRWVGGGDPEGHTGRLGRNKIYQKLNVFLQYHGRLERNLFDQIQYHGRLGKNFDAVLSAATGV